MCNSHTNSESQSRLIVSKMTRCRKGCELTPVLGGCLAGLDGDNGVKTVHVYFIDLTI